MSVDEYRTFNLITRPTSEMDGWNEITTSLSRMGED